MAVAVAFIHVTLPAPSRMGRTSRSVQEEEEEVVVAVSSTRRDHSRTIGHHFHYHETESDLDGSAPIGKFSPHFWCRQGDVDECCSAAVGRDVSAPDFHQVRGVGRCCACCVLSGPPPDFRK